MFLIRIELDFEANSREKNSSQVPTSEADWMSRLFKEVLPGFFFLFTFDSNEDKHQIDMNIKNFGESDLNLPEISPLNSMGRLSNLIFWNEECKKVGLENKNDFLQLIESMEITYVYKKEGLIDLEVRRDSFDEKESDLIHEENHKKNLLTLIKSRMDSSLRHSATEDNNCDTITMNGYINFKDLIKKSIRLHVTNFRQNHLNYIFFHFEELVPNEDLNKLKEISNFKDQMLANVAHDLRSPISGIISFINQSLEPNVKRSEREKLLEYAKINANLLLHLVGDILDFSQIKKGALSLVIKKFSLRAIINQIFKLMKFQAEIKNVKLQLEYTMPHDVIMESDDRRISQLLINLLGNAIKFTVKGFVTLRVEKTDYSNLLKFEIKDSGIGIKQEIIPQLFKPFATFSDKGFNKFGIGLGLSISKKIVSLLGPCDRVHVVSNYGRGTKFGFLLYTKMKKSVNSSMILNVNKKIWEKKGLNKNRKRINSDCLHSMPLGKSEIIEEDFLERSWNSQNCKELKELGSVIELDKELEPNEKVDFSFYFKENNDFSISFIEENYIHNELRMLPMIPIEISPIVEAYKIKKDLVSNYLNPKICSNSDEELEGENISPDKKNMKKVFSLNGLNESKIKVSENFTLNVLIVDDNYFNILILTSYLKKMKNLTFNVYSAMNGSEACNIFEEHNKINDKEDQQIHVVFMDCQMPIMNGYEATAVIKDKINNFGYLKALIVAITAYCNEKECLDSGMDAYLLKPVSEMDFLEFFEFFLI